jgi:cold shock CspA family protein
VSTSPVRMRVHKYIPDRLFGFCEDESGKQVFFHLAVFHPGDAGVKPCSKCLSAGCSWVDAPPPPILGEEVEVTIDVSGTAQEGKAARALHVERVHAPKAIEGTVDMFDGQRGFGFVMGEDGVSYHLHTSEILDKRIPRRGQTVMLFAGTRQGRPRACHVKVC